MFCLKALEQLHASSPVIPQWWEESTYNSMQPHRPDRMSDNENKLADSAIQVAAPTFLYSLLDDVTTCPQGGVNRHANIGNALMRSPECL